MDNLNIHSPASLPVAFEPREAKWIADKLGIHYTSKHGSWLNMADIELALLYRRHSHSIAFRVWWTTAVGDLRQ